MPEIFLGLNMARSAFFNVLQGTKPRIDILERSLNFILFRFFFGGLTLCKLRPNNLVLHL